MIIILYTGNKLACRCFCFFFVDVAFVVVVVVVVIIMGHFDHFLTLFHIKYLILHNIMCFEKQQIWIYEIYLRTSEWEMMLAANGL